MLILDQIDIKTEFQSFEKLVTINNIKVSSIYINDFIFVILVIKPWKLCYYSFCHANWFYVNMLLKRFWLVIWDSRYWICIFNYENGEKKYYITEKLRDMNAFNLFPQNPQKM